MSGRDTSELSISREALLNIGAKVVQAVVGFAGVVILTRILGNAGLGRYRTVLAAGFLILTVSEDIAAVIRKLVAEVETEPRKYLMLGLIVHVGVTVVTLVSIAVGRSIAVPYFGSVELAAGVVVVTASVGSFSVLNYYQAGIGYPARETWADSLRSVLTLGLQVVLLVLGFEAFGAVIGLAVASTVSAVFVWLSVRHRPVVPTVRTVRRTFEFARYSVPSSIANSVYQNSIPLFIRSFSGAGDVGFYAVASQLSMPGTLFASSISSVLTVKSSGVDSVDGDVHRDLANSVVYIGLISVPILFGALALSDPIMQSHLFGETYGAAPGVVLVGMALVRVLDTYKKPFSSAVGGIGRPDIGLLINGITVLTYLPTAVVLGREYGLNGVIAGAIVAEGVALLSYQIAASRLFNGVILPKPVAHQFIAGTVMFGVVEAISRETDPNRLTVLGLLIAVGATVYFLTLFAVSQHFRETIYRTLGDAL